MICSPSVLPITDCPEAGRIKVEPGNDLENEAGGGNRSGHSEALGAIKPWIRG